MFVPVLEGHAIYSLNKKLARDRLGKSVNTKYKTPFWQQTYVLQLSTIIIASMMALIHWLYEVTYLLNTAKDQVDVNLLRLSGDLQSMDCVTILGVKIINDLK